VAHQIGLAAVGDGLRQHRIELHHPLVLGRAVVGVLELAVGVLKQGLQFERIASRVRSGGIPGSAEATKVGA
jgi:hypothetical protein